MWDSPTESYLSHQHTQSYVSVLSNLSRVGQVGQSYEMLSVPPTHSILCVRPIPPVPCGKSGTVLWKNSPMESYLSQQHTQSYMSNLSHLSHVGQVGQSYGILSVPSTHSIPPVPCRTSGTILWNSICPINTLNPTCPM